MAGAEEEGDIELPMSKQARQAWDQKQFQRPSKYKKTEANQRNGMDEGDSQEGANPNESQQDNRETQENPTLVRLRIERDVKVIERRKTLLSMLVTNERVFGGVLRIYKHWATTAAITILWIVCHVNILSICFESQVIPNKIYVPINIFFCSNLFIYHSVFLRIDIIKELAKSFNFWFAAYSVTSFHICFILLWGPGIEIFCIVAHSILSVILLVLYDAHAGKYYTVMKTATFIGSVSYLPIVVILLFHLVDYQTESIFYKSTNVELLNVRLQALDNLTTFLIYLMRIIFNHLVLKKPSNIVFLANFYHIEEMPVKQQFRNNESSIQKISVLQQSEFSDAIQNKSPLAVEEPSSKRKGDVESIQDMHSERDAHAILDPHEELVKQLDPSKHLVIGIFNEKTVDYDPHQTIFHIFILKRYRRLSRLMKSKYYNNCGVAICFVSILFSMPLSMGLEFGYAFWLVGVVFTVLGTIFFLIQMITATNLFLFRHMLFSFDYWYVLVLIIRTVISSGILCDWDSRIIFWIYTALTVKWCIMIDTFTIKYRKLASISVIGALWSFSIAILCKLNIGPTFSHERHFTFQGERIAGSRITLSTSFFSIGIFALRFFWSFRKNHHRILFLTENIEVDELRRR